MSTETAAHLRLLPPREPMAPRPLGQPERCDEGWAWTTLLCLAVLALDRLLWLVGVVATVKVVLGWLGG